MKNESFETGPAPAADTRFSFLELLTAPHQAREESGTVVMAMSPGEVHDIGKTVIQSLFKANGFKVMDLGTLAAAGDLAAAAVEHRADIVGVSCMLTSSLTQLKEIARALEEQDVDVNFLVGGPGLTPAMTACHIAPFYTRGLTIYVKDLYQCHELSRALLDSQQRAAIKKATALEYMEIRTQYHQQKFAKEILSLEEARQRRTPINWEEFTPQTPSFLGNWVIESMELTSLTEYIDWSTLFLGFGLKGKFPQILRDPRIGEQAQRIYDDGCELLDRIVKDKLLEPRAVIGFYPANSVGDDIEIYSDRDGKSSLGMLHTLRQQAVHEDAKPYYALADFIAPKESGKPDFIGAFAVSCGFGLKELQDEFSAAGDDYRLIMAKVLADCLAEALAEHLHSRVRREYWGYAPEENLSIADMYCCRFQGIRPAPGYPACPEHSEKEFLFNLLDVTGNIKIDLTPSYAMAPAASVCGFYFCHPQSKYYWLGTVGRDQVEEYARRKDVEISFVEQQLQMHLNYV
ncbi:MAG: cobalamin-dependent protein [Candidatus Omnitrophica bacterium]|nr:cobalamin-dependent protein [Candidatus Omnitrophota bacterium]